MKISEAFEMYLLEYINMGGQSLRTIETHQYVCRTLVEFFGDIEMSELTIGMVSKWYEHLAGRRRQNTMRLYVIRLRRVLDHCRRKQIPALNPELIPVPKRIAPIPTFLTPEEVTRMIDHAGTLRNKFVIALFYSSGIRLSELIALNRGQIVNRKFTLRGKGDKVRLCFIDDRTEKLMGTYLKTRRDHCEALIVSFMYKERMTKTNIELLVRNAAKKAGITKRVTPHVLRHSFATNFLQNNGNMGYLKTLMGHKSMDTTMMYAHVVDNDLERQYNRFHSIDSAKVEKVTNPAHELEKIIKEIEPSEVIRILYEAQLV